MKGIIINQDCTCMLTQIAKYAREGTIKKQDIVDFPKQFEGTHVTDYFINVDGAFPSEVRPGFLERYYRKTENGKPVDFTDDDMSFAMHYMFDIMGIDHNAILIDGFRRVGINPWISFRMNDIHGLGDDSPGKNDFFYEHPETYRVKFHPEYVYTDADRAYDFTHDIVRKHHFDYIEEALARYDAYGIELDYQRECELFAEGYAFDGIELMNQFMRDIKVLTDKYARQRGHEIKIAVRVIPEIQDNLDYGLNVMQWVKEGLVDMVIPTGRFESNDTDMPLNLWKTLLEPYNVVLVAGIDMYLRPYPTHKAIVPTVDTLAACAACAYSHDVDKIYFFNYFHVDIHDPLEKEAEYCFDADISPAESRVYNTVVNTFGDPKQVEKMNRHHIVTYKDRCPFWKRYTMGGQQLPQTFWRQGGFKIHVGKIPDGAEVIVRFATENDDYVLENPPRLFVNSEPCEYVGTLTDERFTDTALLCYKVPVSAYKQVICSYIITGQSITVKYGDVIIKP